MLSRPNEANQPVFSIIISEKGGAERREEFNQTEISIGRVQGNDLMLPKGNVSKRHSRLLFRDGRFIVTDLNSTNGTYVNRRRISQATIVREGDRIYIGDFVLRIDVAEQAADVEPDEITGSHSGPVATAAEPEPEPAPVMQAAASAPQPAVPRVPGPPRVPSGHRTEAQEAVPEPSSSSGPVRTPSVASPSGGRVSSGTSNRRSTVGDPAALEHRRAVARVVSSVESALPTDIVLDGQLTEVVVQRLATEVEQHAGRLAAELAGVDAARVVADARAELAELGPLGNLLTDEAVSDVSVPRYDSVIATRAGLPVSVEPPFSSDTSLRRVIARLCRSSGEPLLDGERTVERRLGTGARLTALVGPARAGSASLAVSKPLRLATSLEDLVRGGTISRGMATFLHQVVTARANVLVVGPQGAAMPVVSGLAGSTGDAPIVLLQQRDDLLADDANVTRVSPSFVREDPAGVARVAAGMAHARIIGDGSVPNAVEAVLEAIQNGSDGAILCMPGRSLSRGLLRVSAAAAGRGGHPAAARELVASSFDVFVEVARLRDGRQRVLTISEPVPGGADGLETNDIFRFTVERTAAGGSLEGAFQTTGRVPFVVDELIARGVSVDRSLFQRGQ